MRGSDVTTGSMFSYVDLEARVPKTHPLRAIREMINEIPSELDGDFAALYAAFGRPSIAPEKLLRGMLLQALLHHSLRAPTHGVARLQPVVSLVCRAWDRRSGVAPHDLFEEL